MVQEAGSRLDSLQNEPAGLKGAIKRVRLIDRTFPTHRIAVSPRLKPPSSLFSRPSCPKGDGDAGLSSGAVESSSVC